MAAAGLAVFFQASAFKRWFLFSLGLPVAILVPVARNVLILKLTDMGEEKAAARLFFLAEGSQILASFAVLLLLAWGLVGFRNPFRWRVAK